ncbi:hypothetical protein QWT69_01275 [Sporosarcina oncorhynchi]|uniref:Lipoprotein n=1 Tax=Sporosarcina oncorhynchi TaxID=3056444 RepID=A0ABZ0L5M3_9BACL|nr:hypothetical protein [Sporosarcina sp. T2O-4]WOV87780.1 hypothetical protein QWT69_01275 [Sporosarcina sp. T2O-4]
MISIRKWLLLYTLLIALLLVGCVDDEKEEEEIVATPPEEAEVDKTITIRPEIDIMIGFDKGGARASRDKHCWEEKDKECSLEPTLPSEFLDSYIVNPIKPGDDILFQFAVPGNDFDFPEPDSFIAYMQEGDEMKPIEVNNNTIQAPLTPGKYYMSVKAIWDNELKGETIYAFSLMVKE